MLIRSELKADCAACLALCCVLPPFAASAEFAFAKPAGKPCPHLSGHSCSIHGSLRADGFAGCAAFDCFGAGPRLVRFSSAGAGGEAGSLDLFDAGRRLSELSWYLIELTERLPAGALRSEVDDLLGRLAVVLSGPPAGWASPAPVTTAGGLLRRAGDSLRRGSGREPEGPVLVGADLSGRDLRQMNLLHADLTGVLLIGADLRRVGLGRSVLLNTDLRGADVRGAALAECLYLTQPLLESCRGDSETAIPGHLERPGHWTP